MRTQLTKEGNNKKAYTTFPCCSGVVLGSQTVISLSWFASVHVTFIELLTGKLKGESTKGYECKMFPARHRKIQRRKEEHQKQHKKGAKRAVSKVTHTGWQIHETKRLWNEKIYIRASRVKSCTYWCHEMNKRHFQLMKCVGVIASERSCWNVHVWLTASIRS